MIEVGGPSSDSTLGEQRIICPQCGSFISELKSVKRVLAYPAPVGDYYDDAARGTYKRELPQKPVQSASQGEHRS
jgi:hypothetical protein